MGSIPVSSGEQSMCRSDQGRRHLPKPERAGGKACANAPNNQWSSQGSGACRRNVPEFAMPLVVSMLREGTQGGTDMEPTEKVFATADLVNVLDHRLDMLQRRDGLRTPRGAGRT